MALLAEKRKQMELDLQLRREEEARQEEEERIRVSSFQDYRSQAYIVLFSISLQVSVRS